MGAGMIVLIVSRPLACSACCIIAPITLPCHSRVQKVREAAARTQSVNNLKHITLGMQSFNDANKYLPYNGTGPPSPRSRQRQLGVPILPYVDQTPYYYNPRN